MTPAGRKRWLNGYGTVREVSKLLFVTQHVPTKEVVVERATPAKLKDLVQFHAQDFFVRQSPFDHLVGGPQGLFKFFLHDWSDVNCESISRNLTPAIEVHELKLFTVDRMLPAKLGAQGVVNPRRAHRATHLTRAAFTV